MTIALSRRARAVAVIAATAVSLCLHAGEAAARELKVGPGLYYTLPSQAARDAQDGDTVLIAPATYRNDVAVWSANDLRIEAMEGGPVHLHAADGKTAQDKAIWVIQGDNVSISGITFSGARSKDWNGAGIRAEGGDLTITGCEFYDNDMGILSGNDGTSTIVITDSNFHDNGKRITRPNLAAHNIYIGRIKRFVLTRSRSTAAYMGHTVKSRALENLIAYNHIADHRDGAASYLVDLPGGGKSLLIGNVIQQGPKWENDTLIAFGAEKKDAAEGSLTIVHNTLVNTADRGTFVRNSTTLPATIINTLMVGPGDVAAGPMALQGLVHLPDGPSPEHFADPDAFDYRLKPGAPAVDAGVDIAPEWMPEYSFHHITGRVTERHMTGGAPDAGAFEAAQ